MPDHAVDVKNNKNPGKSRVLTYANNGLINRVVALLLFERLFIFKFPYKFFSNFAQPT